jgi:hypothetical protein
MTYYEMTKLLTKCRKKLTAMGPMRRMKTLDILKREKEAYFRYLDNYLILEEFIDKFGDTQPFMMSFYNKQPWFDIYIQHVRKTLKRLQKEGEHK